MLAAALALTFALAYVLDVIAIRYREACNARRRYRSANLGAALEALGWAPLLLAFRTGDPELLAAAAVAASWIAHVVEFR